jgi:hypothetical protein
MDSANGPEIRARENSASIFLRFGFTTRCISHEYLLKVGDLDGWRSMVKTASKVVSG